jgi:hypothetical protein
MVVEAHFEGDAGAMRGLDRKMPDWEMPFIRLNLGEGGRYQTQDVGMFAIKKAKHSSI